MRARGWCFTFNNYTDDDEKRIQCVFEKSGVQYAIYGREVGANGTPHLQGYIYWSNARASSSVLRTLKGSHITRANGNAEVNKAYCGKDGDVFEVGTCPISPLQKGEKERARWARAITLAKSGALLTLEEEHPDIYWRYYTTANKIAKDFMVEPPALDVLDNVWLWGKPNTGKSWAARHDYGTSLYIKNCNKWWDGYQGQDVVIIDEVEKKSGEYMGHFLKLWADAYPFNAERKGSAMLIRPKRIVITSNYAPESVFDYDEVLLEAIRRRFKVVHFSVVYSP